MKDGKVACAGTTAAGTPCRVPALAESRFCFFHDPGRAAERREAQAIGGRNHGRILTTLTDDQPDVQIRDSQDVIVLVSDTINAVLKGRIDPRIANTVGYLANVLLKAVDQGVLEERLAELEAVVKRNERQIDVESYDLERVA